jgi:rhomboid family GlyGly-CTERM serine protease
LPGSQRYPVFHFDHLPDFSMSEIRYAHPKVSALLVLAGVIILIAIGGAEVGQTLRYERETILSGQFWRLITGSLVHLDWSHLLLNVTGLIMISAVFGQVLNVRGWLIVSVVCALGVGLGLLFFNPFVNFYVGFSGILHGLFAASLMVESDIQQRTRTVMLGLLLSKLLWEQTQGPLPGTAAAAGGNVIVDAHLYGAVTGIALGGIIFLATRRAVRSLSE